MVRMYASDEEGNLRTAIQSKLDFIQTCDDGGGIAFAYQDILLLLLDHCDYVVDGLPSIVDESGGI